MTSKPKTKVTFYNGLTTIGGPMIEPLHPRPVHAGSSLPLLSTGSIYILLLLYCKPLMFSSDLNFCEIKSECGGDLARSSCPQECPASLLFPCKHGSPL